MKIKVKLFNQNCKFEAIKKGEWIDLKSSIDIHLGAPYANVLKKNKTIRDVVFSTALIPLGIGMKLPKGYEAIINPRSSTFNTYGITLTNSQGVIDSSYSGPNDEWKFQALAFMEGIIKEGDRICQFRIQPSQKATIWQKIKWLFTNKIEFEFVDDYEGVDRGGFGTTGV
jgi:dUTP pyrophosphatase